MLTFKKCLKYKTSSSNAHTPTTAYPHSAGYGFWPTETKVLKPWSRELIKFDLLMTFPVRYYGKIVGRSGLANVHGITVHIKTIDSNYRGIVCVVFFNLYNKEFVVKTDNCIAQMIIERCFMPKCVKVSEFNEKKTKKGDFFFFFLSFKKS